MFFEAINLHEKNPYSFKLQEIFQKQISYCRLHKIDENLKYSIFCKVIFDPDCSTISIKKKLNIRMPLCVLFLSVQNGSFDLYARRYVVCVHGCMLVIDLIEIGIAF